MFVWSQRFQQMYFFFSQCAHLVCFTQSKKQPQASAIETFCEFGLHKKVLNCEFYSKLYSKLSFYLLALNFAISVTLFRCESQWKLGIRKPSHCEREHYCWIIRVLINPTWLPGRRHVIVMLVIFFFQTLWVLHLFKKLQPQPSDSVHLEHTCLVVTPLVRVL